MPLGKIIVPVDKIAYFHYGGPPGTNGWRWNDRELDTPLEQARTMRAINEHNRENGFLEMWQDDAIENHIKSGLAARNGVPFEDRVVWVDPKLIKISLS
jgi:hypothetical protein